ncbi:MAG: endo-1,4-beta-xylanase, partial [Planctomycetota bacterium]
FEYLLAKGTGKFLDSAQLRGDRDRSCEAALESIAYLEKAIEVLGELYAVQSISFRKQREPQIGTLLAATVVPPSPVDSDRESEFISAFNSAAIRLSWSEIENDAGSYDYTAAKQSIQWCASHGIRVVGGPLLDFRDRLLPHWLYLLEDDFEAFLGAVTQFVEKTVEEFRGTVQLWNCAAGLNTNGPITLDDEQAMRLAIGILQTVRRADPNTPTIFSFDQPFGEYLSKSRDGISPLHFADALARSGLGLAGFGLEVRLNYRPNGTLPRSAVEFGQMVDRWATLGMPLLVQLVIPGGRGSDPLAVAPSDLLELPQPPANPSAEQLRIAGPIVRTLLAKHIVHGIVWDGWSDAEPHVLSHAGMVDAAGRSRPLLEYLTRIRRDFLT